MKNIDDAEPNNHPHPIINKQATVMLPLVHVNNITATAHQQSMKLEEVTVQPDGNLFWVSVHLHPLKMMLENWVLRKALLSSIRLIRTVTRTHIYRILLCY
jgi:hypothetical protein